MSWFGGIYFGEYSADASASAPAPPPVVPVVEPAQVTPPQIPTGAGRWIHLPPTYVPIGVEYEPILLDAMIAVVAGMAITAECEVVREVDAEATIGMSLAVCFASGSASARVIGRLRALMAHVCARASAIVVVPSVMCAARVAAPACMEQSGSGGHVEWTQTHVHLELARQRIEEEILVLNFEDN